MNFLPLHFGTTSNLFVYLRRYLNEILKLNPPLAEINKFDNELGKVIGQFIARYNTLHPDKKLPTMITISNELWAAVGIMLGETRLREEVEALKTTEPTIVKLLQGQSLTVTPPYTAELQACDKKIAELFGDSGAVAAATGFEPNDLGSKQNRGYRGEARGDKPSGWGHVNGYSMHLYYRSNQGGEQITGVARGSVYVPIGFTKHQWLGTNQAIAIFYYPQLGVEKNVTLVMMHIDGFKVRPDKINNKKSVLIGIIGTQGGDSGYHHSHIEIHRGWGLPNSTSPNPDKRTIETQELRDKTRVFFNKVFCP